jgi:hypothetical protein
MSEPKNGTKPASKLPIIIVFGQFKGSNIDQAAFFAEKDAPAARHAAAHAGLSLIELESDEEHKAAADLKEGVVNAQGRFSLSPVSRAIVSELRKLYELKRQEGASVTTANPTAAPASCLNDAWRTLQPGMAVLAAGFDEEDNLEGWYPATIVKADDSEFVVRWRDFPTEPNCSRSPEYLALLHPSLGDQ